MGIVLSLMNEKGGVGKSTVTYSVAWWMMKLGFKVLIVDMDGQKANISYLAGVSVDENTPTMRDVLSGVEYMQNAVKPVAEYKSGSLSLIPAGFNLSYIPPSAKIAKMKDVVADVKDAYDFIFFDVNPSPDWRHALTLAVLDYIAVIMMPDVMSLEANSGIFDSILEVKGSFNPDLKVLGFLMNQYEGQTNLAKAVLEKTEEMAAYYKTEVFGTAIRKSVQMAESAVLHKGVTDYASKSPAACDVRAFVDELLQKLGVK